MAHRWIATAFGPPDAWEYVETEVPAPGAGEITVRVHAAGVNPADAKHVAAPRPGLQTPVPIGYEISGVVTAIGPGTRIGSGAVALGDEVLAFRITGGYATEVTIPADTAFHKPAALSHAAAANLLLAGATAAEMLAVTGAARGETILVHGASGAVGVSVVQQAVLRGIRVIGTAGQANLELVRRFGAVPVTYGDGLEERVREAAGGPISAGLDTVGTAEAGDVSSAVVGDRERIVTIVDAARAAADGTNWIAGALPASALFRDRARADLVELAGRGLLEVPISRTFPLREAIEAQHVLATGHPGGKLALIP